MASIFGINFGSKIPSTAQFEASTHKLKDDYERFNKIESSDQLQRYNELDQTVNSSEFKSTVKKLQKEKFKDTLAYAKEKEYKALSKSRFVKKYNKLINKGKTEEAEELKSTAEIVKFFELKEYISSKEFIEIKTFMTDKNKFKKSDECKLMEEYNTLSKSDDLVWYFKTQKNNSFDELNKWELTFEENFDANKLDQNKWLTGYFWGKTLLNDNYVQANEKQFFTDNNIQTANGCAQIVSKSENIDGKVWDPSVGFRPQTFNISSGTINTGQSFRQHFGRFEAKVKFTHNKNAKHIFSLLSESMTPQINIFKSNNSANKISIANFWDSNKSVDLKETTIKTPTSTGKYLIYSLDWSKDKLEWKINGTTVHTQTSNIPQDPMYLSFGTHFLEEPKNGANTQLDIDWVKSYKMN